MCCVDGELGSGPSRANAWGRFSCCLRHRRFRSAVETCRKDWVSIGIHLNRIVIALNGARGGPVLCNRPRALHEQSRVPTALGLDDALLVLPADVEQIDIRTSAVQDRNPILGQLLIRV